VPSFTPRPRFCAKCCLNLAFLRGKILSFPLSLFLSFSLSLSSKFLFYSLSLSVTFFPIFLSLSLSLSFLRSLSLSLSFSPPPPAPAPCTLSLSHSLSEGPVVLLNSGHQLIDYIVNERLKRIVELANVLESGQGEGR